MILTTPQMLDRLRRILAFDLDGGFGDAEEGDVRDPVAVPDSELLPWLNQAHDELGRRIGLSDPNATLTVVPNQRTYLYASAFSRRVIEVHALFVDGLPYGAPVTDAALEECAPNWRTEASGRTRLYIENPSVSLTLFPAPDAAAAARAYRARVTYLPALLTVGNSSELPEEAHPHVPNLAAVMAASPFATEAQQAQRLAGLRDSAYRIADRFALQNVNDSFDPSAFARNREPRRRSFLGRPW